MPIYKDYRYTEKEDHIIIRAYCGDNVDIVVPEAIKGKPVREISPFAFVPEMDEIEIANNDYKKRCSKRIHSVQLPDTVLRLELAFACCFELEEICIPRHAELIEDNFHLCYALKRIHVDTDHPMYTSRNGILYSKDGTKLLRCPPGHACDSDNILSGVTEIGANAFEFCANLTELVISETVVKIEGLAFANCHNLASIKLHENIQMVGGGHFWCCKALDNVIYYNTDEAIPAHEFYSCTSLKHIDVRSKIGTIGESSFSSTALVDFSVPIGTKAINKYAFLNCNELKNIRIPRSVSRIHKDAFTGCGRNYYTPDQLKDVSTNFGMKPAATFGVVNGSKAEKFCLDNNYAIFCLQG